MNFLKTILNSFVFWGAWIIIPVLAEILPSLGSIMMLLKWRIRGIAVPSRPSLYPEVSLIVPVYNSADTLSACIESIYNSTYPRESIRVFLVNNRSQDESFSIFAQCQARFPDLRMQWMDAEQGKSRAMNLALYNSEGKYIINLDSDGVLERTALANMVNKFEAHPDVNCMTGAILTRPEKICSYRGLFSRLLRNLEFRLGAERGLYSLRRVFGVSEVLPFEIPDVQHRYRLRGYAYHVPDAGAAKRAGGNL